MVDAAACIGCGHCLLTCPPAAITARRGGRVQVVAGRCTECWGCAEVCPTDAIGPVDDMLAKMAPRLQQERSA